MLVTPAYAATAGAAPGGAAGFIVQVAPLLLIFVVFYFLLIRPQQKRMRTHREMIDAVKKNDVAITSGGLIGKVTKVEDNEVELEIASGVKVRVVKGMLSEVRANGTKPAND
ncbi:preprotein translocase subunit YajC [Allosphingosinicella vermicomposti]|uniref:preprotein translocase subunit YajC n=1 Tax=Allosphingosinicella vermicomposti TaxID=614671 RepID=UPI000D0E3F82|nr:preprotein translocase subunit YajC [Allosphingosinicella vermicomposti]